MGYISNDELGASLAGPGHFSEDPSNNSVKNSLTGLTPACFSWPWLPFLAQNVFLSVLAPVFFSPTYVRTCVKTFICPVSCLVSAHERVILEADSMAQNSEKNTEIDPSNQRTISSRVDDEDTVKSASA